MPIEPFRCSFVSCDWPGTLSIPGASTLNQQKNSRARKSRQETRQESSRYSEELRGANRRRRRKLPSLKEADPEAARPGLAACAALDAAYRVGADEHGSATDLVASLTGLADAVAARRSR
jgi:hypothetical protein